jgi:hypothetical protein
MDSQCIAVTDRYFLSAAILDSSEKVLKFKIIRKYFCRYLQVE